MRKSQNLSKREQMLIENLRDTLRERRIELGLTQLEVAEIMAKGSGLKVSAATVSQFEIGSREPGLISLHRLCTALQMDIVIRKKMP